jgi:hypothetical protein
MSWMAGYLEGLTTTMQEAAGEEVTYRRGNRFVTLTGVPGRRRNSVTLDESAAMTADLLDWLFRASELVIEGAEVRPERGDLIERTVGDKVHTFEVWSDGSVDRYDRDPLQTVIRVRTKLRSIA